MTTKQITMDRLDRPVAPKVRAKPGERDYLRERLDEILDLYIAGMSLASIVDQLKLDIKPHALRAWLTNIDQMDAFYAAQMERAHGMIERNLELAVAVVGAEPKLAADVRFKLAALAAPDQYSEKRVVELTGKNGGAVQLKADLTLTPAEAYERMLGAKP